MERQLDVAAAEATSISLDIAGLGARCIAFKFDLMIRMLVSLCWVLVAQVLLKLIDLKLPDGPEFLAEFGGFSTLLLTIPATAIFLLYHPVVETIMRGRTPGKRIVGIRVATVDGHAPGAGAIFVRNIFRMLDSAPFGYVVGLAVTLFTAKSVRIGDLAANTVLVYEDKVRIADFEKAERISNIVGLNDVEQSVLIDLLDRWHGMDHDRRAMFAKRILTKADITLDDVEGRKMRIQGKLLRRKLLQLANPPRREDKSESVIDTKAAA